MKHKLSDILVLTIFAVISDAEGWENVEDFGETHLDFLKQFLCFCKWYSCSRYHCQSCILY
ncbi:Mobile element protein [Escherichia coli ISC7]|uniref:Mobile element protein n=1 Tax=Escherichia coli ISC7 TaxID=1432555 RepID=W1F699_ECOLX|nr:Mobile element protein [Escherichia coli ISC7]